MSIDGKYLKDLQRGQSFGELALLYSCKRSTRHTNQSDTRAFVCVFCQNSYSVVCRSRKCLDDVWKGERTDTPNTYPKPTKRSVFCVVLSAVDATRTQQED